MFPMKSLLLFSNHGYTGQFIENNKLGHSFTEHKNVHDYIHILKSIKNNKIDYYQNFSKNSFDLSYLFEKYVDLLI